MLTIGVLHISNITLVNKNDSTAICNRISISNGAKFECGHRRNCQHLFLFTFEFFVHWPCKDEYSEATHFWLKCLSDIIVESKKTHQLIAWSCCYRNDLAFINSPFIKKNDKVIKLSMILSLYETRDATISSDYLVNNNKKKRIEPWYHWSWQNDNIWATPSTKQKGAAQDRWSISWHSDDDKRRMCRYMPED